MLVLVSPTKTQKEVKGESNQDSLFGEESRTLLNILQAYSLEDLKERMKISDKLAISVHTNYAHFKEDNIAILTYKGSSFQAMQVDAWSTKQKTYANTHLFILSALYGLVRPFDLIGLYRLDFLNDFEFNLYPFWQERITTYLNERNEPILNLASQEYTKMIDESKLTVPLIKIDFKEQTEKGFVVKSTYAKIARGTMCQLLMQKQIKTIAAVKKITFDGYHYNDKLSSEHELIFTR